MGKSIFVIHSNGEPDFNWSACAERETAEACVEKWSFQIEQATVVEYAPVGDWVLVAERLPEHMQLVEFVRHDDTKRAQKAYFYRDKPDSESFFAGTCSGSHAISSVLCWRADRPIGELPQPGTDRASGKGKP